MGRKKRHLLHSYSSHVDILYRTQTPIPAYKELVTSKQYHPSHHDLSKGLSPTENPAYRQELDMYHQIVREWWW